MKAYGAFLYHDEPEEASADSRGIGTYPTRTRAIAAVRTQLGSYWQTGSVHVGELTPGVLGVRPDHFEEDEIAGLRVGPDWTER